MMTYSHTNFGGETVTQNYVESTFWVRPDTKITVRGTDGLDVSKTLQEYQKAHNAQLPGAHVTLTSKALAKQGLERKILSS